MKILAIDKTDWSTGLERSRRYYTLIGPGKKGNNVSEFRELAPGEEPDLACADTTLSPKSLVFPRSEVMFEFSLDAASPEHHVMRAPRKKYSARAVIGIRPYDAAAMLMVRMNFATPRYRDPYWCDAYEACTFIGLAVTSPAACDFSPSSGSGPFATEGLDVLLVDVGERFLARVLTDKGDAWLTAAGFADEAPHGAAEQIASLRAAAEAKIRGRVEFDRIAGKETLALYHADFWEGLAFACINCGACTYVCPTCWCFDIQDETSGMHGRRMKNWDSCMFPLFTRHTSGHNPRGSKLHRLRQRFMHKLKYHQDKYGQGIMCVGCGRCITSCPVNIDIRQVCAMMNR